MKEDIDINLVVDDMYKEVKFDGINYTYDGEVIGKINGECLSCEELMQGRKKCLKELIEVSE